VASAVGPGGQVGGRETTGDKMAGSNPNKSFRQSLQKRAKPLSLSGIFSLRAFSNQTAFTKKTEDFLSLEWFEKYCSHSNDEKKSGLFGF
jgi:hypothetical protein